MFLRKYKILIFIKEKSQYWDRRTYCYKNIVLAIVNDSFTVEKISLSNPVNEN